MKPYHSSLPADRPSSIYFALWFFLLVPISSHAFIENGGFEELDANGLPKGWHLTKAGEPDHEEGGQVQVRVTEGTGHSGKRAIELHSEISSYPCFFDQNTDEEGNGPLPIRGTISFWYKILEGTVGRPAVTVMGAGTKDRYYPGGYYIPVTFANDGDWHYAELGYDLSHYQHAKSAFIRIYIMSYEIAYPAPTRFLVDDVKFHAEEPVFISPCLLHVINHDKSDSGELRLYLRNMSLKDAAAALELQLPSHLRAEDGSRKIIRLPASFSRGFFGFDSAAPKVVTWQLKGKRKTGDLIAVRCVGSTPERSWLWKRKLEPDLQIEKAAFSQGLVPTGQMVSLDVAVRNNGDAYEAADAEIEINHSSELRLGSPVTRYKIFGLKPGGVTHFHCDVESIKEGKGMVDINLRPGREKLPGAKQAIIWIDDTSKTMKPDSPQQILAQAPEINSGNLYLRLGGNDQGFKTCFLFLKDRDNFTHLASSPWLGRVLYPESAKEIEKIINYHSTKDTQNAAVNLMGEWQDAQGAHWRSSVQLRSPDPSEEIQVVMTLETDSTRSVSSFQGPFFLVGDGSTGEIKDAAQFPGLEWLENEEPSSNQSNIVYIRNQRVPHPNKITVPSIGYVINHKMVGLMWDPLQLWDGENDRPCAIFDSPNRTWGEANHLMGLFLPSIPKWVNQNDLSADKPYQLTPGKKLELRFSIIGADHANELSPVLYWHKKHGPASPPALDRTYDQELSLCKIEKMPEINVEKQIRDSITRAEEALKRQAQDGWWPWSYSDNTLAIILAFTYSKNIDIQGAQGDTAIGAYSPNSAEKFHNIDLFRAARYTGNTEFVEASLRALKRADEFRRPEGAQPWELPIHTPDLLGSAYGVLAFLEGYKLTGDKRWLEQARWWAGTGLPFIYVWGARDQPHMKYAAIAVYGGSFMDYLLLGQGITWVAMDYAESLIQLAEYDPEGPWRKVAQGIVHNCILQHEMSGPKAGQWPDWRDLIKNRVLVDVWYPTPRPGNLLLKWLGKDPEPKTTVVKAGTNEIRVTADGEILMADYRDGKLIINLAPFLQKTTRVCVAGIKSIPEAQISYPNNRKILEVDYHDKYGLGFIRFDQDGATTVTIEARVHPGR